MKRDELAAGNEERNVTRRRFLGISLASGAALLAGKSDVILGADTATSINMATNPTFNLGGDFTVNRLGFGAMRVTGEGIWGWPADRQNALKVLRRAVELGVNLIDTADAYGPDTSELLIAEALYPYPKGLVIATKGGLTRPSAGQWVPNCRPDHLKQALEGRLKRLRLGRIDSRHDKANQHKNSFHAPIFTAVRDALSRKFWARTSDTRSEAG